MFPPFSPAVLDLGPLITAEAGHPLAAAWTDARALAERRGERRCLRAVGLRRRCRLAEIRLGGRWASVRPASH